MFSNLANQLEHHVVVSSFHPQICGMWSTQLSTESKKTINATHDWYNPSQLVISLGLPKKKRSHQKSWRRRFFSNVKIHFWLIFVAGTVGIFRATGASFCASTGVDPPSTLGWNNGRRCSRWNHQEHSHFFSDDRRWMVDWCQHMPTNKHLGFCWW